MTNISIYGYKNSKDKMMVNVAIIGAGRWGPNFIRQFDLHSDANLISIVDTQPARIKYLKALFPNIDFSSNVNDVLDNPKIEAVIIATPATTHFDLVTTALNKGKHVLVEKPITIDSESASKIVSLAQEKRLVLMVGHIFVYNSSIRYVRDLILSNELGKIFYLSMVRTNLGPIRSDVSAAWDLASHDISIANYWLQSAPLSVSAMSGSWINSGINDACFATFRYPNDVLVNIRCSWLDPRKSRDITVVGNRAMLVVDDLSSGEPIRLYDKGVAEEVSPSPADNSFASFRSQVREGEIRIPHIITNEPLSTECGEFIQCINGGQQPLSDGLFGLDVVLALEALQKSETSRGEEVSVRSRFEAL